jgi:putative SbcD/Mre11-related phosphoesterase
VVSAIPVQGKPALLIKGRKPVLCVADLHIGYEIELRESGFNVPDQTQAMLSALIEMEEGDSLVILGDLKHSIPTTRAGETLRISRLLRALAERFSEVTMIAGNHDGAIEKSLPDSVRFVSHGGTRISSIGMVHGHSWPSEEVMKAKTLVWGHLHPCVRMYDRLGAAISMKCWLRGPTHPETISKRYGAIRTVESIVMPSFNHLLTGTPVNEGRDHNLSPLTRSGFVAIEEQRGCTLDGVDLGVVSGLSQKRPKGRAR